MSKALKVIGTIAGAVVLVATGVGLVAAAAKTIAVAASVAKIATVVAAVATVGSSLLQKPPPARGSVAQILIQSDAPQPYVMGEGLTAGILRHDTAYGATLNKVPNPYRFMAVVYSGAGPIQSITPYVDQSPVSSWYSGFLYTNTKLGAVPESSALSPQWSGAPGWSTASKLSGKAAIGWSFLFDKSGKRFASGIPQIAAYGRWVKVYDPRLDSTFPGGSGSHRLGVESTYQWSENPALHAGMYAYGRYQNGKRVMGVGLPKEAINWTTIAAWANVCDANAWSIFGVVYEPGDRWQNLRDICFAGGGEPAFSGGVLSFKYSAPKIPLDTLTEADLIDDNASVTAQASWRDRVNTVIPKYRSPAHNWEMVSGDEVSVSSYVTEDGERKSEEIPFNFVKKADQAEQLAAYRLVDGRELQPIIVTCGPRMFAYRPGECLHLDLPSMSLDTDAIIVRRDFDPTNMTVTFTLLGETPTKHAFALGKTGAAPATPSLKQTGEERDDLSDATLLRSEEIADALALADAAFIDANAAIDALADLANDGIISRNEKITKLIPENASLEDKWTALSSVATSLGVSTATASAARTAWNSFLGGLSPAWNNIAADTTVSRSAFNTARDDYDTALYQLDKDVKAAAATLATWADVTGTGRPADNATRNEDTANMLESPLLMDTGFEIAATTAREFSNTTAGPGRDRYRIRLDTNNATYAIQSKMIPVSAGEKVWLRAWMFAGAGTSGTSQFGVECFNTAQGYVSAVAGPENPATAGASWFLREAQITLPAGVSYIRPYFNRYGGSGGNYFIAEPAITRHQLGADVTLSNTAAGIAGQAATATNSDYTAVTGTKPPADADKTSINTSANTTNVGTVPSTAVQSTINTGGGVANNQVVTASIVTNAVNDGANAFLATLSTRATGGTVDGLSVAYTSTGGPIRVDICLDAWKSAGSTHTAQIQLVQDIGGTLTQIGRNLDVYGFSGDFTPITYWGLIQPAAGAVTYKIRVTRDSGTGTLAWARQAISVQEFKR